MNGTAHTASAQTFSIHTDVYSGPLELLIDLIEKRKLLINDISLASVTDDYMRHVAEMEEHSLRETTQFIAFASTLLLIKSKSLLPVLNLTEEEEENIDDLENRLKLYQIYRNAGKIIEQAFGQTMCFGRKYVPPSTPLFVTDRHTEQNALRDAIKDVIQKLPQKEIKPKVKVRTVVSLEEMIDTLKTRVENQFKLGFKDFTGGATERSTIIVGFLAVLEMVKQGKVMVHQAGHFDDIQIEKEGSSTPRYI